MEYEWRKPVESSRCNMARGIVATLQSLVGMGVVQLRFNMSVMSCSGDLDIID